MTTPLRLVNKVKSTKNRYFSISIFSVHICIQFPQIYSWKKRREWEKGKGFFFLCESFDAAISHTRTNFTPTFLSPPVHSRVILWKESKISSLQLFVWLLYMLNSRYDGNGRKKVCICNIQIFTICCSRKIFFSVYLLNISTFQHFELMELNVSAQLKASHSLLTLVLILKWWCLPSTLENKR